MGQRQLPGVLFIHTSEAAHRSTGEKTRRDQLADLVGEGIAEVDNQHRPVANRLWDVAVLRVDDPANRGMRRGVYLVHHPVVTGDQNNGLCPRTQAQDEAQEEHHTQPDGGSDGEEAQRVPRSAQSEIHRQQ